MRSQFENEMNDIIFQMSSPNKNINRLKSQFSSVENQFNLLIDQSDTLNSRISLLREIQTTENYDDIEKLRFVDPLEPLSISSELTRSPDEDTSRCSGEKSCICC